MSSVFKREEKYIVVKFDDLHQYLSDDDREQLSKVLDKLGFERENDGKPAENRYVVVNQDEPYIETIWKAIEYGETKKFRNVIDAAAKIMVKCKGTCSVCPLAGAVDGVHICDWLKKFAPHAFRKGVLTYLGDDYGTE